MSTFSLQLRGNSQADALAAIAASDLPDDVKTLTAGRVNATPTTKGYDIDVAGTDTSTAQQARLTLTTYQVTAHLPA